MVDEGVVGLINVKLIINIKNKNISFGSDDENNLPNSMQTTHRNAPRTQIFESTDNLILDSFWSKFLLISISTHSQQFKYNLTCSNMNIAVISMITQWAVVSGVVSCDMVLVL